MAEIIKTYAQVLPSVRFIGRQFGDSDRVNGGFGKQWGDAFTEGWFAKIEEAAGGADKCRELYEDGGAYIGLMCSADGQPFQYWIGMFTPSGTEVPEGFAHLDFPASEIGVAWLYGNEKSGELYCKEPDCLTAMSKNGISVKTNAKGEWWFMERYVSPRFTQEDEKGNVILDICFFC